ncbi:hypothetical protein tb265_50040 [Gemmatimonadetes bacterium T265]|nr:hypothetical protein tb265_50040 [Gemmatimonadetes bacterium T265]
MSTAPPPTGRGTSERRAGADAAAVARIAPLLMGESGAMRHLREDVVRAGRTALPVLVQGPTGAGKELVARAVHVTSGRCGEFVAFNVCAVAEPLFEAAVFGSVRGAFTGATADTPGYLTEAHRGTVFLDEIGGLPAAAQAKLLRAIETKVYRPVGARADRCSDFRVVSATNDDVDQLVDARRFREDLAERLAGIVLHVPPLAARRSDVPLLVRHFAVQVEGAEARAFTEAALERLMAYDWPRNVRELRHVVARALAWCTGPVVDVEAVRQALPRRPPLAVSAGRDVDAASAAQGRAAPPHTVDAERRELVELLRVCAGDTERAARTLGVARATLYRRLERLGIRVKDVVSRARTG